MPVSESRVHLDRRSRQTGFPNRISRRLCTDRPSTVSGAAFVRLFAAQKIVGDSIAAVLAVWLGTPLLFYMYIAPGFHTPVPHSPWLPLSLSG